jgi:adenylate cyclase
MKGRISIITAQFFLAYLVLGSWPAMAQDPLLLDSLNLEIRNAVNDSARAKALNHLAGQYRYGNTDTALIIARQALKLGQKIGYREGIARSKRLIGALYASQGNFEEGAQIAGESAELFRVLLAEAPLADSVKYMEQIGSSLMIVGHNRISQGDYAEGLKFSLEALKIRERLGDKRGMADLQYNIANIYGNLRNFEEALKYNEEAMRNYIEMGLPGELSWIHIGFGYVYAELGRYEQALYHCNEGMKLAQQAGDEHLLAEIYTILGTVMERENRFPEALNHYEKALDLYSSTGIGEQIPVAYNNIATVYIKMKSFSKASHFLDEALKESTQNGGLSYLKLTYENKTILDSLRGDYKGAFENHKKAIFYRDSIENVGNTRKLVRLQMQYDFDKKETETREEQLRKDVIASAELSRQKMMRNGFIGGFATMLVFSGVFLAQRNKIRLGKKRSDELLLNILPQEVAEELKLKGEAEARLFDEVTVMFTDFQGFTQIAEKLGPAELVTEIDKCFRAFDEITTRYGIEKIKTIGDSYMCAGGLPVTNSTHASDVVQAALEIQQFMNSHAEERRNAALDVFEIRIGIHTGPVVAGIVGVKKFAYDIWGDTVNTASRMESSGFAGKVNISGSTHAIVQQEFTCEYRGKISAKNKGETDMYFVTGKRM